MLRWEGDGLWDKPLSPDRTWCLSQKKDGQMDIVWHCSEREAKTWQWETCPGVFALWDCNCCCFPSFSKGWNWLIRSTIAIYQKEHLKSSVIFSPPSLPAISKAPINVVQKYHLDTWLVTSRLWYVRVLHRDKRMEAGKGRQTACFHGGWKEYKWREKQRKAENTFPSNFHNERSRVC